MTSPTPSLDTLVSTVARASMHCPPSIAKLLLEACDMLEADYDSLQFAHDVLKTERDALKAELEAVQDCFKAVEHISRYQRGQWECLDKKLARVKASTVADQITNWAEANYSNSHEAQAVVEGCYDTEELEAFGSLAAFKKHAGIRDDYREDIINA